MYGFHLGFNGGSLKRRSGDSNTTENAGNSTIISMPTLTNKIVYGNASAIELCTVPGAFGPSYVSLTEMKFCNLTSLELSDITVPLPAGKVVRSDTPTIDFVIRSNPQENARSGNADIPASGLKHKAVKLQFGSKGEIFDLASL
jgi:hypothetical protein